MADPDIDLLRRINAGDRRAAEAFVRKHAPRLCGLARRMLADAAEAEDVAQEVFLRAWKEAPRWREGQAQFTTWMHRVTVNLCLDRLRRRREFADPDAGADEMDQTPSAVHGLMQTERAQQVQAAVEALPPRQRAALVMCHFEERSAAEAAAALNVSIEALESLLARARRTLRAALAQAGEGEALPAL